MAEDATDATPLRPAQAARSPSAQHLIAKVLRFHLFCPRKRCRRTRRCARLDAPCFAALWPHVPERERVGLRAIIEAAARGGDRSDLEAARRRAVATFDAVCGGADRNDDVAPSPDRAVPAPLRVRGL